MRYLLLLFSLLVSLLASAQTKEYPFVEEGKTWVIQTGRIGYYDDPYDTNTLWQSLRGDTIIDGKKAKKHMIDSILYHYEEKATLANRYLGAFYEEDNKLYYCDRNTNKFVLIFDCGMSVGDSMEIEEIRLHFPELSSLPKIKIDSIGWLNTNTSRREFFIQDELFRSMKDTFRVGIEIFIGGSWIEGVGTPYSKYGSPIETWAVILLGGASSRMVSCTVGNRVEYLLTGITTPTRGNKSTADTYYSIDGRRLTAPPARGVYLHNGRKVVK